MSDFTAIASLIVAILAKDIPNNNCYDFAGCRGVIV
jgi:hypothetical protein